MTLQDKNIRMANVVVLAHFAITVLHGISHGSLHIALPTWANLFVFLVIVLGPLDGLLLLKLRKYVLGAWTLFATLSASLVFGLWNHFVIIGPDHVAHLPQGSWQIPFQITAVLLPLTEAAGALIAARMMRAEASAR